MNSFIAFILLGCTRHLLPCLSTTATTTTHPAKNRAAFCLAGSKWKEGKRREGEHPTSSFFFFLSLGRCPGWLHGWTKWGGEPPPFAGGGGKNSGWLQWSGCLFPFFLLFPPPPHPFYLAQLRVSLSPSFLWKRGRKKDKGMEGGMHFLENSSSLPLCFVERGGAFLQMSLHPPLLSPQLVRRRDRAHYPPLFGGRGSSPLLHRRPPPR